MMRKLYGFFNKTFSLLITTCFENTWPVCISMPPPIKKIWVETTLFVYFYFFFFWRGGGGGGVSNLETLHFFPGRGRT